MRPSVEPAVDMVCSKHLSFSRATPRRSYRRRKSHLTCSWSCCKALVIACLFILLLLEIHSAEADEDWTTSCPTNCNCKWVGGKKRADCQSAGFNSTPDDLSPQLQELDLSFNSISQLSKNEFEKVGLVKLRKVLLRSCNIETIDRDAFRNLKILIELDLSENKLESLHMESFESNKRLRELRLKGNLLTKLHGVQFPPLLSLKLLDLSNCQLSQLNAQTFEKLSNLERLDLTGNKFQNISEEIFKSLTKLKGLSLKKNPWKCDCLLRSFRDWIVAQKFYLSVKCAEPGRLENFEWSVLQSNNFACRPEVAALQIGGPATQALIVYADVGKDITLECLVSADPAPQVKWTRNGRVLTTSYWNHGKVYLLNISGEYERSVNLTILKSDLDDAGEYFCVGYNAAGIVEKKLTLKFQDVPRIGTGVGRGIGACSDHSWLLWILNGVIISVVIIMTVCFCNLKRRLETGRAQDLKAL